ncbi:hypothetical protein DFJ73DRAFT_628999 [Zopfochytrium polystomum]|nr:hypothetical protein DFJ73DRAFT_628999 [Zopfochytrium polystomum]
MGVPHHIATKAADSLVAAYASPSRHYHSTSHIAALLSTLDKEAHTALRGSPPGARPAVYFAIWFHDAVYDTKATHGWNEEESARLWIDFAEQAKPHLDEIKVAVAFLIRLTISHRLPNADEDIPAPLSLAAISLFLDLDLSVLGADSDVYDSYVEGVRLEYADVYTTEQFRKGRAAIMRNFLHREKLFFGDSDWSRRLEERARRNIQRELEVLEG